MSIASCTVGVMAVEEAVGVGRLAGIGGRVGRAGGRACGTGGRVDQASGQVGAPWGGGGCGSGVAHDRVIEGATCPCVADSSLVATVHTHRVDYPDDASWSGIESQESKFYHDNTSKCRIM